MNNNTVLVNNLTKTFGKFTAVDQVSFEVKPGEIFGFLGPNGAGKSTTIKMLCGIISPTSGEGHVGGYDIVKEQKKIKLNIGYMSQKFSLYDDLTVMENLEFIGSIYGLSDKLLKERTAEALNMAGIVHEKDMLVKKLPGGIKQRLALGAAVLHNPPILFLDEPTSGVDPVMRRNFWELIYKFSSEGRTVFVTTHYMEEAEHCDRIALIISGKLIALDSPSGLKDSLDASVFAVETREFLRAFDTISSLPFVREASIFGSEIHFQCQRGFEPADLVQEAMEAGNFGKYKLTPIHPTLEDVFVVSVRKIMG